MKALDEALKFAPEGFRTNVKATLAHRAVVVALMCLALGGCGNCGGWTNPWYQAAQPHSCQTDRPSGEIFTPILTH